MQTAPGSKTASLCCVWAKSMTLPPGRTAAMQVLMSACAAYGQNDGVGAAAFSLGKDPLDYIFRSGIDRVVQPEFGGDGVAFGIKIGGEDAGSSAAGQGGVHEADGALADDQHSVVGCQVEHLYALEDGVDGLQECSLLEGNAVGNRHDTTAGGDPLHDADVLGKSAATGLKTGCRADFFIEWALRRSLLAAVVALAAWHVVVDDDTVAEAKFGHALAELDDGPGHLVAEDARGGVGAGVDFLRSVPQTPQVATLTSSSPGPIAGTGTVSTRMSLMPR